MTTEDLKIPPYLLKIYKEMYEYYYNETVDDDVIILPKNINDIYNIDKNNLVYCF